LEVESVMNEQAEKAYKSPRSKLVRFFEKSRDQWKAKCLEAKATAKGLKHRIRYLEQSKAEWKTKAKELEQELARVRAQQHGAPRQEEEKKRLISAHPHAVWRVSSKPRLITPIRWAIFGCLSGPRS
jgi:septal ring factor EnvC (AmiA/AmiB activator)